MSELMRIAQEDCELEMTPMIDVTFLLLIFFICTIKFKTLEGKLSAYLPKDVGVNQSDAEPKEKTEILLKILAEGSKLDPVDADAKESRDPALVAPWSGTIGTRFVYGSDRVVQYKIGPRGTQDIDELRERLIKIYKNAKKALTDPEDKPAATIDPRKGSVYEDVVLVLDAAIDAEFTDITFVGSYED